MKKTPQAPGTGRQTASAQIAPMMQAALGKLQKGELSQAEAICRDILALDPEQPDTVLLLGVLSLQQGKLESAIEHLSRAVRLRPNEASYHLNLGAALLAQGRPDAALACNRKAIELNPGYLQAHVNAGEAFRLLRKHGEARACHERVLQQQPNHAEAHYYLGLVKKDIGDRSGAVQCFRQALHYKPDFTDAANYLGMALQESGDYPGAMQALQLALSITPLHIPSLNALSDLNYLQGHFTEAIAVYDTALRLNPDLLPLRITRATLLERTGARETAMTEIDSMLAAGIQHPDLLISRASMAHTADCVQDTIGRIDTMLEQADLTDRPRSQLHFALGHLYDSHAEYTQAFEHFRQGNALKRHVFDPQEHRAFTDSLVEVFSRKFLSDAPAAENRSELPVFIVGMPRSGTTLVEQILDRHHQVYGGGELPLIRLQVESMQTRFGLSAAYPRALHFLSADQVNALAEEYLAQLADRAPNAVRVTDKMPGNFHHLGLIQLLFPAARVIHCVRDPLDTCLSCYFQDFREHADFFTELTDTGYFHNHYAHLMRHWKETLSLPILDVNYEELVSTPATIIDGMLVFLGLEPEPGCLSFHESERVPSTMSYNQTSKPLYNRSIARWKHYATYLDELKTLLEK